MKKLLLAALGIFLMTAILESCKDNSSSLLMPMKQATTTSTTANPAICYLDGSNNLAVMDSDGTHQTAILSASAATISGASPNWAPGSSVVFGGSKNNNDSISAIDVSVNSSGVPVGSNLRAIATTRIFIDSIRLNWPTWSSTSTVNKIAFEVHPFNFRVQPDYICKVSASGGAWDTLHAFAYGTYVNGITWSPDDSKLAVLIHFPSGSQTVWSVVVMNATTGATTDSIKISTNGWGNGLDWSRTSATINKLLTTGSSYTIDYLTPTTGSSPTTNNVSTTSSQSWSPNNSSVMFVQSVTDKHGVTTFPLKKVTAFTSTTTTLLSNFSGWSHGLNWHR